MLTAKQVSDNFQIPLRKLYKIAKEMNIEKVNSKYYFPDDFIPIYIPDGRKYRSLKKSNIKSYVYIMDVIAMMWLAKDNYMGIDNQIRETVVRELKKEELIKLKVGATKNSLDYRDYILSLSSGNWLEKKVKERETFIINALESTSKGISKGVIEAMALTP